MKYLRVTDLLARHCKLPLIDVPNIAYYDCHDLPDWSLAYNDRIVQLVCSVTFMDGVKMERICTSFKDLKLFVKDANYYATRACKLQKVEQNERYKRADETLRKLIKEMEDKENA